MIRTLQSRVERLERGQAPESRNHFIFINAGETVDNARQRYEAEIGGKITECDTAVFISWVYPPVRRSEQCAR